MLVSLLGLGERKSTKATNCQHLLKLKTMTIIFLLRIDSVTNEGEGEAYPVQGNGIINCNVWQSPKLTDHQVIIATGKKAIAQVYSHYENYNIRTIVPI